MIKMYRLCSVAVILLGQLIFIQFAFSEPVQVKKLQDLPYGMHRSQILDIYLPYYPINAKNYLVVFMLHNGTDKADDSILINKLNRWMKQSVLLVSANYRLSPFVKPIDQLHDVAKALAYVQKRVEAWGGDPSNLILAGHANGAYLATLLSVSPEVMKKEKVKPWLGTIGMSLTTTDAINAKNEIDSEEYKHTFDNKLDYLRTMSPLYRTKDLQTPLLLVCSTLDSEAGCSSADDMKLEATYLNQPVETLKLRLSDSEMSNALGKNNDYTAKVENVVKVWFRDKKKLE